MVRLTDAHELDKSENWIALVRSRLALRRAEKPATKAGQIRAIWPEIDAALAGGQSMKKHSEVAGRRRRNQPWHHQPDFVYQPPSPPREGEPRD
jgi:hypothetical protein